MNLTIVGLRKFWTRTATIISILVVVGLVLLEFVGIGFSYASTSETTGETSRSVLRWLLTFPGAFDGVLSVVWLFLGIVGLIYVATASGSEWTWGTLKVAVARGTSRWQYTVATFASLAIILLIGVVIVFAAGLVGAVIGSSIAGLSPGNVDPADLPGVGLKVLRCWIAVASLASVAYAITMVAKSQMAGIGAVIGYFVVSMVAPALLPDFVKEIFKYLPFSISADAIGLGTPPGSGASAAIDPTYALLITIGWLVACVGIAAIAVERAEISG